MTLSWPSLSEIIVVECCEAGAARGGCHPALSGEEGYHSVFDLHGGCVRPGTFHAPFLLILLTGGGRQSRIGVLGSPTPSLWNYKKEMELSNQRIAPSVLNLRSLTIPVVQIGR